LSLSATLRIAIWSNRLPASIRYIAVGAICAAMNNILLIGLCAVGFNWLSSAFIVCGPIIVVGFVLHTFITFKTKATLGAFLRYSAALLANYPILIIGLFLLCDILHLPVLVAGPVTTIALFAWNYVGTRWAIFKPTSPRALAFSQRRWRQATVLIEMKRPQRIAFICDAVSPWHKGGREKRLQEITRRLVCPGREIHVYTMNWWNGPKVIQLDGIHYHALCRCYPLYKDGRRSIIQALMFSLAVFNLLFEEFDVIDVDHMPYFSLYSARIVSWLKGKRLTATWHEVWGYKYWMNYLHGPAGLVGYLIERISFALPDIIVSNSQHTTKSLQKNGARCRIETIPLGIDIQAIAAVAPAEVESDIIYIGRLIDNKRVGCLIESIALVQKTRPDVHALIVGSGPEEAKISQLIHDLKLQKNVQMLGAIDEDNRLYALMKASKVLVLPSAREGFGLVILEAFAGGIPVVTTSDEDNAARELVNDKVNGRIASAVAGDIREKIEYVLDMRAQMRPDDGLEQHDWRVAATHYERLLEPEIAAKRGIGFFY